MSAAENPRTWKRGLGFVCLLAYGIGCGLFFGYGWGSRAGYRAASEDDAIDLRSCRFDQLAVKSRLDEARSWNQGPCIDLPPTTRPMTLAERLDEWHERTWRAET